MRLIENQTGERTEEQRRRCRHGETQDRGRAYLNGGLNEIDSATSRRLLVQQQRKLAAGSEDRNGVLITLEQLQDGLVAALDEGDGTLQRT
jgi:hypothetical protein